MATGALSRATESDPTNHLDERPPKRSRSYLQESEEAHQEDDEEEDDDDGEAPALLLPSMVHPGTLPDLNGLDRDRNGHRRAILVTLPKSALDLMAAHCSRMIDKHPKASVFGGPVKGWDDLRNARLTQPGLGQIGGYQEEQSMAEVFRQGLMDLEGYWQDGQEIQFYFSWLRSQKCRPQWPHIDYEWKDVLVDPSFVPFIAVMGLSEAGMHLQIWPNVAGDGIVPGRVVYIPYGSALLLRADVIHGGGLASDPNGNPRGHCYIHRTAKRSALRGVPFPGAMQVKNLYVDQHGEKLADRHRHATILQPFLIG